MDAVSANSVTAGGSTVSASFADSVSYSASVVSRTPLPTLTLSLIRQLSNELGIQPTKKLGQNFVHDAGTVRKIAQIAQIEPGQSVLEIGPGLGSLTLALLERGARVTAVEIDPILAGSLLNTVSKLAPNESKNLQVVNRDGLELCSWQALAVPTVPATKLVANLPYNVAVPLLLNTVQALPSLEHSVVMVQAEVADRLVALPGSRIYGAPTVKLAWYGRAKFAGLVSRTVFWPQPNVDSALVEWHREPDRGSEILRRVTFKLVDLAFGQRRKMIRTPLRDYLSLVAHEVGARQRFGRDAQQCAGVKARQPSDVNEESPDPGAIAEELCTAAKISPTSRAESLTIDDYVRLGEAVLYLQAKHACLAEIIVQLVGEDEQVGKSPEARKLNASYSRGVVTSTEATEEQLVSDQSEQITSPKVRNIKPGCKPGNPKLVVTSAPGKVNLVLHSSKKGEDGYHQLATIFEALSLREVVCCQLAEKGQRKYHGAADSVVASLRTVAYLPNGSIDLAATAEMLGVPRERHLAVRAAELLAEYAKMHKIGSVQPVHLDVQKHIPVAGGMAGGSADAAATLVALNQLWNLELTSAELEVQARKLGADVPACLMGGTCLGLGRGDQMRAIAPGLSAFDGAVSNSIAAADPTVFGLHWWVLAIPAQGLSTPAVFQTFDSAGLGRESLEIFSSEFLDTTKQDAQSLANVLENDLQQAALCLRPELAKVGEFMLSAGALRWIVSGSGPTIAALAPTQAAAKKIQTTLEQASEELAASGCALKTVAVAGGPARGATVDLLAS